MADQNNFPSNLEFNQQELNYIPDPNVFKDAPSDLDYNIMFENFRDTVNSVVYPTNYQPTKSFSTGNTGPNYNPYNENVNFSNNQLAILKEFSKQANDIKNDAKPLSPVLTSKKLTDYERYYNHPMFQQIGYSPFRDNETLYNENSTVWDDFSRMGTQFPKLLYTGFVSSYRSIGDLFDDDDYFTGKDLDSAREFADAMRIGNSTRGGVGGFLNNLGLQSAYTFGIIANIAVEEALLSAVTGGGSLFTTPIRAAARTGESLKNMTRVRQVREGLSSNVLNRLDDVDEAKTFWQSVKSGDSKLMNILLPETMQARKTLNSSANVVNNISDIGKSMKTFGGFYRDMRGLNLALSEAKMEAGMVYDQVVANGLSERMKQSETDILSDDDLKLIKDNADKASMVTTMLNAPFIYLSNQLLLGTAFGSFNRSLSKVIGDNTDAFARRIITKPVRDASGKIIDSSARKVSKGISGTLEKMAAEGLGKVSGAMALRYFASNFGEGVQEVYQEAVAKGTEYYYNSIIKSPVVQQRNLFHAALAEGLGSQMSGQGFEVFMSGFLMGGLVSGPQQILFRGVPNIKSYLTNREEYDKENEIFETALDKYVENYNNIFKSFKEDPDAFLDTNTVNAALQKMISDDNANAVQLDSVFDFLNGKEASKFIQIYSLLNNNSVNLFRNQLNDYLKLSDEDIATAFPMLMKDSKAGKAKERITSFLKKIDTIEEDYVKHKNKYENPFDETKFDKVTERTKHISELHKRIAFEHVTFLAMFSSNQIKNTAERMQSIFQELESVPLFENMAANDLTVLLSEKRTAEEINLLKSEIEILEQSQDQTGLKEKKQKLNDLQKIYEISQDKSKKGVFKKTRKATLRKAIITYANNLAKNKDTSIDTLEIDSVIQKIFDYAALEKDNYATRQTVEMLNNPQRFDELFDRTYKVVTNVAIKSRLEYALSIAKIFHQSNFQKYLYQLLNEQDVRLDPEELVAYANTDFKDTSKITKYFKGDQEQTNNEILASIRKDLDALAEPVKKQEEKAEQEEEVVGTMIVSDRVNDFLNKSGIELPQKLTRDKENKLKERVEDLRDFLKLKDVYEDSSETNFLIEDLITIIAIIANNKNVSFEDVYTEYLNDKLEDKNTQLINSMIQSMPLDSDLRKNIENYIKNQIIISEPVDTEATQEETQPIEAVVTSKTDIEKRKQEELKPYYLSLSEVNKMPFGLLRNFLIEVNKAINNIKDNGGQELLDYLNKNRSTIYNPSAEDNRLKKKQNTMIASDAIDAGLAPNWDLNDLRYAIRMYNAYLSNIEEIEAKYDAELAALETEPTFTDNVTGIEITIREDNGRFFLYYKYKGEEGFVKDNINIQNYLGLEDNSFDNLDEANTALDNISINKDAKFIVNGIVLKTGQTVYDENNKESKIESNIQEYLSNNSIKVSGQSFNPDAFANKFYDKKLEQGKNNTLSSIDNDVRLLSNQIDTVPFQIALMHLGLAEEEDITFTITVNEQEPASEEFRPNKSEDKNDNINYKKAPFSIVLSISDNLLARINASLDSIDVSRIEKNDIAYLNTGNLEYLINNKPIEDLTKMTKEQAQVFYNILDENKNNVEFTDALYDQLINNFASQQVLNYRINELLKGNDQLVYNLKELEEKTGITFRDIYKFDYSKTNNLKDLIFNKFDGEYAIFQNLYNPETKSIQTYRVTGSIQSKEALDFARENNSIQGYLAVVKLPNGKLIYVPLKASVLTKEEVDSKIKELVSDINKYKNNEIILKQLNENQKMFISLNNREYVDIFYQSKDSNGETVDKLVIRYVDKSGDKNVFKRVDLEKEEYENLDADKLQSKFDQLNDKISNYYAKQNKTNQVKIEIGKTVRNYFAKDAGIFTIIEGTETNVAKSIFSKYNLAYQADNESIQEVKNTLKDTTKVKQKPTETKGEGPADVEENSIGNISSYEDYLKTLTNDELNKEQQSNIAKALSANKVGNIEEVENIAINLKAIDNELKRRSNKIIRNKPANLVISEKHDELSVEDIDVFVDWLKTNLPDYIGIDDIDTLGNNLLKGGKRVGAFLMELQQIAGKLQVQGKILTSQDSPGKYHEAFHSVFRMLLSDEQINKLLSIAKKEVRAKLRAEGKNYFEEVKNFRNQSEDYAELTDKELEDLYLEEYMANEFDKFKSNPKSTKTNFAIKNFFAKLIDIIKSLFSRFVTIKNSEYTNLNDLFRDINTGKYKSASILDNRFTTTLEQGDASIANALIPFLKIESADLVYYLDSVTGDALVSNIYARVISKEFKSQGVLSIDNAIDESIDLFKKLYISKSSSVEIEGEENPYTNIISALENYSKDIKEQVKERLRYVNITQQNIEEFIENNVQELNETGLNTNNYNMKAELLGMEKSLPSFVRKYFASTTLVSKDKFGNEYLTEPVLDEEGNIIEEGERIITSINPGDAYSGWLRATQNIYDPVEMLKKLVSFSDVSNPDTKAVVDRMLSDTGLTRDDVLNVLDSTDLTLMDVLADKDTALLNKLLKAFENSRFSYRFQIYKVVGEEQFTSYSFDSLQDNAIKAQIDSWTSEHFNKFISYTNSDEVGKDEIIASIALAIDKFNAEYKSNQKLKEASLYISETLFKTMGIFLHPTYIQYSIINATIEKQSQGKIIKVKNIQTEYQRNLNEQYDISNPLSLTDLQKLLTDFQNGKFLANRSNQLIKKLANHNIEFDESIGTTTFLNPENERIYAHQLPTFNARMSAKLYNDFDGTIESLIEADPILKYNFLANSEEFKQFVEDGYFVYERLAGIINQEEQGGSFSRSGKSYGKLNIEDFLFVLLSSYTSLIKPSNGKMIDSKGNEINQGMAPIFTRVAETSRTGPSFMMPIVNSVNENNEVSNKIIEIFYNYLKGEFERIQTESNFDNKTNLINNYNSTNQSRNQDRTGTAFELFKTKGILNNNTLELFEISDQFSNSKLFDRIQKEDTGEFILSKNTKIGKLLFDTSLVYKITVKKKDQTEDIFIEVLSEEDGKYKIKYSKSFNPIKDTAITSRLESLAKNPENFGKTFEQILQESNEFEIDKTTGFPKFIKEKLEADYNRFLYILKRKNIDLDQNIRLRSALLGNKLDLQYLERSEMDEQNREEIKARLNSNLSDSLRRLNLKSNDLDYNLKQIYFNYFVNSFSVNQLFLGDHAKLFDSFQKEIKRGKAPEAHGISAKTPFASQKLGVGPVESFDMIPTTDPEGTSAISGNTMKVADGQLYMTVKTFKHILWGLGELFTEEHARLLDKVERGDKLTSDEIFGVIDQYGNVIKDGMVQRGEMINLKKYIYSDAKNLVKMSAHVLRRADVSEKDSRGRWVAKDTMVVLHNMLNKMEQHQESTGNLTMMAPLSAIKKLQENINDLNKIQSSESFELDADGKPIAPGVMKLDAEYFMLQQKNPSNKQESVDPTQITWLLQNEQDDNVVVNINGEEISIKDIKKNFEALKSYILSLNHVGKRNLTFQETLDDFNVDKKLLGNNINLASFALYAAESKKASQSSSEKLEFFELDKDGNLKYNLNSPITNKDFEDLLLSYFSNQVFKQKIPGSQLTITADHGRRIYRRVLSTRKVTLNGITYEIPDKQETLRSEEVQRFPEIKNNVQFHIDKDANGNISNVGDDANLNGLSKAIELSDGKGVIIIDRLRYDMQEYTYTDKYDISTWKKTEQRYVEGIMPAISKEVYDYLNLSNRSERVKFTNEKLLELYEEWVSLENVPVKKGKGFVYESRKDRKGFDPELAKISFAKQMGVFYDKNKKEFISTSEFSVPEVLAKLFALRIPTQDKHSSLAVKVVDFMDATNGSTISVAREIIEVSGADFDIDKLFAHMKDIFFNKKTRNFVAYGETKGEEFSDYVRYINKKVRKPGNIYFEAYDKYDTTGRLPYGVELIDEEIESYQNIGFGKRAYIALKTLGLPVNPESFEEFKNKYGYYPLEAMMQNKVLDYKFAMVGNSSVTEETKLYKDNEGNLSSTKKRGYEETDLNLAAVSYEPADIKILEDIIKEFKTLFPAWSETLLEDLFDNDTITGAMLAYENNQVGSSLIGASVLPNSYLPKLGTLGVSINKNFAIKYNNKLYNKYGKILEDNGDATYGKRTQYLMSALISAMVDNATEQAAAKFGININSLGVVSNLSMLGVPLRISMMMIINPNIASLYQETSTGGEFKFAANELLKSISDVLSEKKINIEDNLTESILISNINSKFSYKTILEKGAKDITAEEAQYLSNLYTVLSNYMKGVNLSDYNFNLGVLFSMTKGISSTMDLFKIDDAIENLGLQKDSKKLKDEKHPFDAKEVFVYENDLNAITRTYYTAYRNLKEQMLPNLVMTQTKFFNDVFKAITNNNIAFFKNEGKEKLKFDLASYFILEEYYENLLKNPESKEDLESLTNSLIYPINNNDEWNNNTIVKRIFNARQQYPELEDNFFISNFITIKPATLEGNYTNLDVISNNLMSKIPDHRKFDVISDYRKLFEDPKTRALAVDIFHYLLVKDGLQYRSDSIIQVLSPIVMTDYLQSTGSIFEKLKRGDGNQSEYIAKFVKNYFKSANIRRDGNIKTKTIKKIEGEELKNIASYNTLNEELVFNPFSIEFNDNIENALLTSDQIDRINSNNDKNYIDDKNERLRKINLFTYFQKSKRGDNTKQFIFPSFVTYQGVLYELTNVVSKSESDFTFTAEKPFNVGLAAKYKKADIKGSQYQWGVGFALETNQSFGNLPSTKNLEDFAREYKTEENEFIKETFATEEQVESTKQITIVDDIAEQDTIDRNKHTIDIALENIGEDISFINKKLGKNFKDTEEFSKYISDINNAIDNKTTEELLKCQLGLGENLPF